MRADRRRQAAPGLGPLVAVVLVIGFVSEPVMMMIVSGFLFLAIAAAMTSGRYRGLPVVLRPGHVMLTTSGIAALAALSIEPVEMSAYLPLVLAQTLAFGLGLLFHRAAPVSAPAATANPTRPALLAAQALFALAMAAAAVFVALQGVPVLQGNVEASRTVAATSGTGYLRLLAYLSIPAALAIFAVTRKYSYALVAAVVVVGLGNRSPLLYLGLPLLLIALSSARDPRRTSGRIVATVLILMAIVVAFGSYRITSQTEFRSYSEYRTDFAEGNYLRVSWTSLRHYADVIPRNAVLTKRLADEGALPVGWGRTYATSITTALPGEQLSLDREIKRLTGATFIGGGIPPTLMGEGYANFRYPGIIASSLFLAVLVSQMAHRWQTSLRAPGPKTRLHGALYGFVIVWAALAQVAGLAGASTFPVIGLICLYAMTRYAPNVQAHRHQTSAEPA